MSRLSAALGRFLPAKPLHWRSMSGGFQSRAETVPLSVLESVLAAMAAQRADANAALADLRAMMGKQDAALAALRADISDALSRQDIAMERERASAKEISAAHYKALQLAAAGEVAAARYDADIAVGRVNARVLLERSLAVIWRAWAAKARPDLGVSTQPTNAVQQLVSLLCFPGVVAYLEVVEEDNGLASGILAGSAIFLYFALCTPLHPRGAHRPLPHEVFKTVGKNGLIAFAALVALSRRNVGLYLPQGDTVTVQLRVPPSDWIAATKQDFMASPAHNVWAAVDLGVTPLPVEEEVQH